MAMTDDVSGAERQKRASAHDRLLEAAAQLFYAEGIHATGIDTITATANVAKKSLYNNFASKAELVAAYLEDRHACLIGLYEARLRLARSPRDRVLAMFDAYLDHAGLSWENNFRGCGMLNAAAELPTGHPGRLAVARHKQQIQDLLHDSLKAVHPQDPEQVEQLAEHLSFLLEGSMVRAGLEGHDALLRRARALADSLLAQA